jgi:hypothetical protein
LFENYKKNWQLENQKNTIFLAVLKINLARNKSRIIIILVVNYSGLKPLWAKD